METKAKTCGLPLLFNFEPHPNGQHFWTVPIPLRQIRRACSRPPLAASATGPCARSGQAAARRGRRLGWVGSYGVGSRGWQRIYVCHQRTKRKHGVVVLLVSLKIRPKCTLFGDIGAWGMSLVLLRQLPFAEKYCISSLVGFKGKQIHDGNKCVCVCVFSFQGGIST